MITEDRANELFRNAFQAVTGEDLCPDPEERMDHEFDAVVQSFNVHVKCPCGLSGWWLVPAFVEYRSYQCRACGRLLQVSIRPNHVTVKTQQLTKKLETLFHNEER